MNRKFIEVVDYSSGEVVKTIDVTGKSDGMIEKIERGLLRQLDQDRFYTVERERKGER